MLLAAGLCSCNDFLDRKPLDFGDEDSYFKTPEDLRMSVNAFYEFLPLNNDLWGGVYSEDVVSDNQVGPSVVNLFYKGGKQTVKMGKGSSEWNFENLRAINFFINKTEQRLADGILEGNEVMIDHYLGEGYFFRAYDYFRLLRNFGDVPVLTEMLPDDVELLAARSVRTPRNEVARFIISDLDHASSLLCDEAPESGRVCRDAALALKARVALYEATWEKYHAGTCFVPGNDKWVGRNMYPDFSFRGGSAEAEVNYFLEQAMAAARTVADNRPLDEDYAGMFNNWRSPFSNDDEVILARYYKEGVIGHSCSRYLCKGGGCNATRALVNTYVMANGLPVYAAGSGYKGDLSGYDEMQGRDGRLTASIRFPGCMVESRVEGGVAVEDTIYYYRPWFTSVGNDCATTGYEIEKWVSYDQSQLVQMMCTTAVPLLRSAEAMLTYMEASYMRYGTIDDKADVYWRALRRRAGTDEDYRKTIEATDLTKENDLAVWSKGVPVDATLYNIRRERRCELFAEGLRLDDLKRWRALDMMNDYQPEGVNLWGGELYKLYGDELSAGNIVSPASVSDYVRPLQITPSAIAYTGYTFPHQHYLEPIPLSELRIEGSQLYQNPGWPSVADGIADYTYDCD